MEVEVSSHTTWENGKFVVPLRAAADRITLVSNSLHAEKRRGPTSGASGRTSLNDSSPRRTTDWKSRGG